MIRGHIDAAESHAIGWVFDENNPGKSLEVDVYVAGRFYRRIKADNTRSDLSPIKSGSMEHGFCCELPPLNRPDSVVFIRVGEEFLVSPAQAQRHHLVPHLQHQDTLDVRVSVRETAYRGPARNDHPQVAVRIGKALARTKETEADYGPLWGSLMAGRHRDIIDMAVRGDAKGIETYLSELGRQPLAFGFFDGPDAHSAASTNPAFRVAAASLILDRLVSLNEALGTVCVENPEQGVLGENVRRSPDDLLDAVAAALDLEDLASPAGGHWGIPTRHGVVNVRMVDALYAAWRIVQLTKIYDIPRVTEIGGGAGLVAHYALAQGAKNYTIVDLPTVGAAQAYTLRDRPDLTLYGEPKRAGGVSLVPTWEFASAPREDGGLIFNMDALPEFETDAAVQYLRDARDQGYSHFLSINQESGNQVGNWTQNRVRALADKVGGYTLLHRSRDWMHPGYVEEVYAIRRI